MLKNIIVVLLLILAFFVFDIHVALAHRPHDDIYQVELSPTYDRDKTLFVIVRGMLFKSTDGGQRWKRIWKGLDNIGNLSSLAISSQNKKNLFVSTLGDGIYKSQDEGNSWSKVNNGLETLKIDLLSISARSPEVALAGGSEGGLYKTQNGGESWDQVIDSNNKITAIAFSLDSKDRVILGDRQGTLYFSSNEGDEWKQEFTLKNKGAIAAIAISPNFSSDQTFFVGTEKGGILKTVDGGLSFSEANQGISDKNIKDIVILSNSVLLASTWNEGVFSSNDGGKTWNKSSKGLTKNSQADEPQFKRPHFNNLTLSNTFSQDKTIFLAGFNGLFKSTDGGRVWSEIETLSPTLIVGLALSPDYQHDSTIAVVTYVDGAYISSDRGVTWTPMKKGLEIPRFTQNFKKPDDDPRRFFDVAFSPHYYSDQTIFISLLRNYFLKSTDRGNNWKIVPLKKAKGYIRGNLLAVSPNFANDNTIYLATNLGHIYRSTDEGDRFSIIGNINHKINSLEISPNFASDRTIYASGFETIYKTVDGGKTWQPITNREDLKGKSWLDLAISPNYKVDRIILAGSDQGLFETKDGGKSWEKIASDAYGGDGVIDALAISPNYSNDKTFIITVRGRGSFKTVDGGKTFTQLGDGLIFFSRITNVQSASNPIQFSPSYATDKTIYGFGENSAEIFRSTDGGQTWQAIAIPKHEDKIGDAIPLLKLVFNIYPILKFVVVLIVAVSSYFLLGYLSLEKKLPLSKSQIKVGGSLAIVVLVLILLSI